MTILLTNLFLHSIHTLLKQYSGSIQGNVSLLTLATPWVHLGYTLGRVCEIRHKSIKNPSNRKRKIDISTDEHIRNYQNWLIVARASRVTNRRSQEAVSHIPTTTWLNLPSLSSKPDMRQNCRWYLPIQSSESSREEHTTKPSARPCEKCGYSSPRPVTHHSAQPNPPTAKPRSGRSTIWTTNR